jgi:DNA-binding CsgD family transcriptional regulator
VPAQVVRRAVFSLLPLNDHWPLTISADFLSFSSLYAFRTAVVVAYMETTNHADESDTMARGFDPGTPSFGLTNRERQVVQLVVSGCSNDRIAQRLQIRPQTVKNQLSRIYAKVGVSTRVQLAVFALRHGLAEPD